MNAPPLDSPVLNILQQCGVVVTIYEQMSTHYY
jgi:hypothetical protein